MYNSKIIQADLSRNFPYVDEYGLKWYSKYKVKRQNGKILDGTKKQWAVRFYKTNCIDCGESVFYRTSAPCPKRCVSCSQLNCSRVAGKKRKKSSTSKNAQGITCKKCGFKFCAWPNSKIDKRRYCTDRCRIYDKGIFPQSEVNFGQCKRCNSWFRRKLKWQRFCCDSCREQNKIEARKKKARPKNRARKYKNGITPYKVAKRDNFVCQLCGKKVVRPDNYLGGYGADWWSVDHIIPKSLGGPDTWANVRCVCMSCNTNRGNDIEWGKRNNQTRFTRRSGGRSCGRSTGRRVARSVGQVENQLGLFSITSSS